MTQISITVNGEARAIAAGTTVAALLAALELAWPAGGRIAVERNREIVPRSRFGAERLQEGDCLEIVHFVGGG